MESQDDVLREAACMEILDSLRLFLEGRFKEAIDMGRFQEAMATLAEEAHQAEAEYQNKWSTN